MNKPLILGLSLLLSGSMTSGIAVRAEQIPTPLEYAQLDPEIDLDSLSIESIVIENMEVEIVQSDMDSTIQGWDSVKVANIMGAVEWCMDQPETTTADQTLYNLLSQGASRALEQFVETEEMTFAEANLIKDRVVDQGYYLGLELTSSECTNLRNTVITWSPWQLVTSREAAFSVEMPAWPTRDTPSATIQGRKFDWLFYETLAEPDNNPLLEKEEYYLVGYTTLPQDYLASTSEDEIFTAFGEHIFNEMGFPELQNNSREVTPDGVSARITSGDAYGQTAATVMYIVDDRFYLNLMVGTQPLNFERFFRSFEALDFVAN